MASKPIPQFAVGQKVNAVSFVDCFDHFNAPVPDLTVTQVRLIEGVGMPDYYRVKAERTDGTCRYVEGAERYFEPIRA